MASEAADVAMGGDSSANGASNGAKNSIDEHLYSRQLYVMGHEAQHRLSSANVLLLGLGGVGIEVAKNLVLMGVHSITLYDPEEVAWADLSTQFFCREADIGKPKDAVSQPRLAELNPYVRVHLLPKGTDVTDADVLGKFQAVVCTHVPMAAQISINDFCHRHNIPFVSAFAWGLLSGVFSDFGPAFKVEDATGEPPLTFQINSVSREEKAMVVVREDSLGGMETGTQVVFSDMEGMPELSNGVPRTITRTGPMTFQIEDDTSKLGEFMGSGYCTEIKPSKTFECKPLKEAMKSPEIVLVDFAKFEGLQLHVLYLALQDFWAAERRMPALADTDKVVALAKTHAVSHGITLDETVAAKLARCAGGQCSPMCAAIGGIAAHEVIKACSHKFTPIMQWLYLDAREAIPDVALDASEYQASNSRYDGQVAIFGKSIQEQLMKQRYFLVGAGAIGCEVLKTWAMMGIACGPEGKAYITDMDMIEKSNLSRQFLFRAADVGKHKSTTALAAARAMNPGFNGEATTLKVAKETEESFDDFFWDGLTGVCTALDNVDARLYVDSKCVFHRKPMLESGTLGAKGNTQVVVPHITEHYGAARDPPEEGIPVCTLKHFPNKIEHTLQWAVDWFEGEFHQTAELVNSYLADDASFLQRLDRNKAGKLVTMQKLVSGLMDHRPIFPKDCVKWARLQFEEHYSNRIKQLLYSFPKDSRLKDGKRFWSGTKRTPDPIQFDPADNSHMQYLALAAKLYGSCYGFKLPEDESFYIEALKEIQVPPFVPKKKTEIKEDGTEVSKDDDADEYAALKARLAPANSVAGFQVSPLEFEKDDDLHMALITLASNLRARNYRIGEVAQHESKLIAGKIIPAIATTTAMVSGLICIEVYKLLQALPIEAYRCCFGNLAMSMFAFSEPANPEKESVDMPDTDTEWDWSVWDNIDIKAPMTLREFVEHIEDKFDVEMTMLSQGNVILYSSFDTAKAEARMDIEMEQLVRSLSKDKDKDAIRGRYMVFEICATDDDDDDVELPAVRYELPTKKRAACAIGGLPEHASATGLGAGAGAGAGTA